MFFGNHCVALRFRIGYRIRMFLKKLVHKRSGFAAMFFKALVYAHPFLFFSVPIAKFSEPR
ncbi:MAG: hypothetical protein A2340_05265 [Lentisphaerae bacterium RIFOXYB12_FULL_60_10]|nr:MAG: hypothetical protein A2340_05265 [Lentisphaerae bacterium RIFOXYB12_FULL_60_10]